MKAIQKITVAITLLMIVGCSWVNMFKGDDDWYRNHHAEVLKDSYDKTIQREVNKEPTPGYATKPYAPKYYQAFWNNAFFNLLSSPFPEAYRGPTEREFMEYIIRERRKNGLSEIVLEDRVKNLIEQIKEKGVKKGVKKGVTY